MSLSYSFRSAVQSLVSAKWIILASVLAVASSLLVITLTVVFIYSVEVFTNRLPERFLMVVYLNQSLPAAEVEKIHAALKSRQDIESTRYVSKDAALAELKSMLKEKSGILEGLDENPLSPSIEVRLKRDVFTASTVKSVSDSIRSLPGIEDVYYGEHLAEAIDVAKRSVRKFAFALFSVFVLLIIFVTYSTVNILFYRKREEIEIVRLLGATGSLAISTYLLLDVWVFRELLLLPFFCPPADLNRGLAVKRSPPLWTGFDLSFLSRSLASFVSPTRAPSLNMGVLLANQPFDRGPRSAFTLAGHTLDMTRAADILGTECRKVLIRAELDMVVLASPAAARAPAAAGAGLLAFVVLVL